MAAAAYLSSGSKQDWQDPIRPLSCLQATRADHTPESLLAPTAEGYGFKSLGWTEEIIKGQTTEHVIT